MMYSAALVNLAMIGSAAAHTWVWGASLDGSVPEDAESTYVRRPPTTDPVTDVKDAAMNCNVAGGEAKPDFFKVEAGKNIDIKWFYESVADGDQIIDPSHVGPVYNMLRKYDEGQPSGGWVKISEIGFKDGKWGTHIVSANKGVDAVPIPAGLKAGKYLLRADMLALHEADESNGFRPQFFPQCLQIEVTGSGSTALPKGIDFATEPSFQQGNPSVNLEIYSKEDWPEYVVPGGEVWTGSGGGSDYEEESATTTTKGEAAASTTLTTSTTGAGEGGYTGETATPTEVAGNAAETTSPGENEAETSSAAEPAGTTGADGVYTEACTPVRRRRRRAVRAARVY